MTKRHPPQIVGNMGLYYACYKLSRLGWNVMPTSRNAKGVDIICFSMDGTRMRTFQVKSLSRKSPVPLGADLDRIMGDFWVIVNDLLAEHPRCYVMRPSQVKALAHRGVKDGRVSYWLQPRDYAVPKFEEKWEQVGRGVAGA